MFRAAALALIATFAFLLTACGGGGEDSAATPTAEGAPPATVASGQTPASGDECNSDAVPNLHSTSHEVGVPTSEQVIEMEWETPDPVPRSYNFAFSQNPEEPPDFTEQLPGDATTVSSGPMGQNRWWFYLIPFGDSGDEPPIRCGPYVIERDAASNGGGEGGGAGDAVTLTISVAGGSSVEYFTNQGERLFCGDTSLSGHDVACSAEFVRGSEARIQRTLSLSDEEEARWRLAQWDGACEGIDADVEPRGGQCILVMDEDKDVSVGFAQRAMITVTHTGPSQLFMRWGLDYAPAAQKGGGNPLTLRGQFDCDTDALASCAKTAYFDTGTTITLTAGSGVDNGNLASISGSCSTAASTCEFVLEADAEALFTWKY